MHQYRLQNYLDCEVMEINIRNINYPFKNLLKFEDQNPDISFNVCGFEDEKIYD